ncbi:hypothetical protein, partial [Salmonella sp. s51933]|uniref:hypothetical protein n=1 Tax=Salmonella sp. s51933 TaxID=3160127 RepID=UPI003753FA25
KHGGAKTALSVEVLNIIRWLSKQRNAYGGFSSTQDTCVALQALSEFAGKAYGDSVDFKTSNLAVSLKINSKFSHDFTITKANKMVLQRLEIPQKLIPNQLDVTATGTG